MFEKTILPRKVAVLHREAGLSQTAKQLVCIEYSADIRKGLNLA